MRSRRLSFENLENKRLLTASISIGPSLSDLLEIIDRMPAPQPLPQPGNGGGGIGGRGGGFGWKFGGAHEDAWDAIFLDGTPNQPEPRDLWQIDPIVPIELR